MNLRHTGWRCNDCSLHRRRQRVTVVKEPWPPQAGAELLESTTSLWSSSYDGGGRKQTCSIFHSDQLERDESNKERSDGGGEEGGKEVEKGRRDLRKREVDLQSPERGELKEEWLKMKDNIQEKQERAGTQKSRQETKWEKMQIKDKENKKEGGRRAAEERGTNDKT